MRENCYQARSDGLLLFVKLTPNARQDEVLGNVEGIEGPLIAAKVRAIPDKGKANKALLALIAKWMNITKSELTLKSGHKSRLKTISITGNTNELIAMLDQALGNPAHSF